MVASAYCPDRGDLVWLQFTPHAGREQAGRRPGLVLSPRKYNQKTQLAVICPITSKAKGYPFEVELPAGSPIAGVVLADHVRNVDWSSRQAQFAGTVSLNIVANVIERINTLVNG